MAKLSIKPMTWVDWLDDRIEAIWANLQSNNLWQRMLKNTLATTIAVTLALIPAVANALGKAPYLAAITTVFGHPGRRFGMMAEALALAVAGTVLGVGWSTLGVYLSSLVYDSDSAAAYTIKGLFLALAMIFHGFLRSHTPRLFILVLLLVIVSVVTLTGPSTSVSSLVVTTILYPILSAVGVLLLVNVFVFPEFSSSFLGITTIETLGETVGVLRDAGSYFVAMVEESSDEVATVEKEISHEGSGPDHDETSAMHPVQTIQRRGTTAAEPDIERSKDNKKPTFLRKCLQMFGHTKKSKSLDDSDPVEDSSPTEAKGDQSKEDSPESKEVKMIKLKSLTDRKGKLRSKLDSCKAAQEECNFELAVAVLPPRDLKPISDIAMKKLVANTIALIGACESKYALLGDQDDKESEDEKQDEDDPRSPGNESGEIQSSSDAVHSTDESSADEKDHHKSTKQSKKKKEPKAKSRLQREVEELESVKPRKEIEFGDVELLKFLVQKIKEPLGDLQEKIDRSIDAITACLAYCYDVKLLPSGARPPRGVKLEEIDIRIDILTDAITEFDKGSAAALESAAALQDISMPQIDLMPRMETFLISSFLLNLRQAALHTRDMLSHARILVEKRQARFDRRKIYAPQINWRKWLASGGEEDQMALPNNGRKDARTGNATTSADDSDPEDSDEELVRKEDEEAPVESADPEGLTSPSQTPSRSQIPRRGSRVHRIRNSFADVIEFTLASDDVAYAMKLAVAVMLVTWPSFVGNWNDWYYLNRGLWAALQLVLITEVAIGNSVMVFILRAVGTTLGCIWGYAAYQAGAASHNETTSKIICVVLLVIGLIPSVYIQLGSKYVKAGMVAIISMCIVTLATFDASVPGTATENFLRRMIAFLIGGVVALVVEVVLFPVKARDRLVESLAASIRQLTEMEACLAYGVESEKNISVHSPEVFERFENAKSKAQGALTAAGTFLPFTAQEPRLKGSFAPLALVYQEILFVLHQMVDKMDNMFQLRKEYGSGVLEELNTQVYPYRRNVAGSITLVLFAVHEALTTKLPLPQFLPSARLAYLRMVNRVREVVLNNDSTMIGKAHDGETEHLRESTRSQIELTMVKRILRQKFLSWNAASAGQVEVIEYLEELIDLAKLLVGANEFRSGMLTRPTYREYTERIGSRALEKGEGAEDTTREEVLRREEQDELRDVYSETRKPEVVRRTRKGSILSKRISNSEAEKAEEAEQLPFALQRVRSRRIEQRKEWFGRGRHPSISEDLWTSGRDSQRR